MKKCPFCAEEIQDDAIVCRYCGRDLKPPVATPHLDALRELNKKESKSHVGLIMIIGLVCMVGIVLFGCLIVSLFGNNVGTAPSQFHQVTLEITGSARLVSVTMNNEQGQTEQHEYATPYKINYSVSDGYFAYISAQNKYESGSVTCTIYVDYVKFKTATSTGAYVIATCDGIVE